MDVSYSGPHVFTGKAPKEPRETCYGCSAHYWLAKKPGLSCALLRLQRTWVNAAGNRHLVPFQLACREPSLAAFLPDDAKKTSTVAQHLLPVGWNHAPLKVGSSNTLPFSEIRKNRG